MEEPLEIYPWRYMPTAGQPVEVFQYCKSSQRRKALERIDECEAEVDMTVGFLHVLPGSETYSPTIIDGQVTFTLSKREPCIQLKGSLPQVQGGTNNDMKRLATTVQGYQVRYAVLNPTLFNRMKNVVMLSSWRNDGDLQNIFLQLKGPATSVGFMDLVQRTMYIAHDHRMARIREFVPKITVLLPTHFGKLDVDTDEEYPLEKEYKYDPGSFVNRWCVLDEEALIIPEHPLQALPQHVFRFYTDLDANGVVEEVACVQAQDSKVESESMEIRTNSEICILKMPPEYALAEHPLIKAIIQQVPKSSDIFTDAGLFEKYLRGRVFAPSVDLQAQPPGIPQNHQHKENATRTTPPVNVDRQRGRPTTRTERKKGNNRAWGSTPTRNEPEPVQPKFGYQRRWQPFMRSATDIHLGRYTLSSDPPKPSEEIMIMWAMAEAEMKELQEKGFVVGLNLESTGIDKGDGKHFETMLDEIVEYVFQQRYNEALGLMRSVRQVFKHSGNSNIMQFLMFTDDNIELIKHIFMCNSN